MSATLTVLCVWVRGHVPFTAQYVMRLRGMARRTLPAHRFVCLTDTPHALPADIETLQVELPRGVFGWWAKVRLFDPALPLSGRLLYFDLDVLLLRGLDAIVEYPARFVLAPDGAPGFRPRDGRQCVKRFNSSVMAWTHGEQAELFEAWDSSVARRLWGDQDWIGERCPEAVAMPVAWFPRLSAHRSGPPFPEDARVLLCKKPKNEEARRVLPWFEKEWR